MVVELSKNDILELVQKDYSTEFGIINKFGKDEGFKLLRLLTDNFEVDADNKLGLPIVYKYTKQKEDFPGAPNFFSIDAYLESGEQIGCVHYKIYPNLRSAHLNYIAILTDDEKFQGVGVGHKLIGKMESVLKRVGVSYIEGHFCPIGKYENYSRKFYERHGFSFVVDYNGRYRNVVEKNFDME